MIQEIEADFYNSELWQGIAGIWRMTGEREREKNFSRAVKGSTNSRNPKPDTYA